MTAPARPFERRAVLAMAGLPPEPALEGEALPAAFISHGAPTVALEESDYTRALASFGASVAPRLRGIAVISAHWETPGHPRVTASARPGVLHDFSGFPPPLYQLDYPALGHPALAAEIVSRLNRVDIHATLDPDRPLDHGAWVPLRHAFPEARIPVVQLSLPSRRDPAILLKMGAALAPLRAFGILLLGSGGLVHNLWRIRLHVNETEPDDWAVAFERWVMERLQAADLHSLMDYARAPGASLAVPTSEHFDPLFVVLGAALDGDRVEPTQAGIRHGNLSMRSFVLGRVL